MLLQVTIDITGLARLLVWLIYSHIYLVERDKTELKGQEVKNWDGSMEAWSGIMLNDVLPR